MICRGKKVVANIVVIDISIHGKIQFTKDSRSNTKWKVSGWRCRNERKVSGKRVQKKSLFLGRYQFQSR